MPKSRPRCVTSLSSSSKVPSSRSNSMRSRAESLPSLCWRFWRSSPPPCSAAVWRRWISWSLSMLLIVTEGRAGRRQDRRRELLRARHQPQRPPAFAGACALGRGARHVRAAESWDSVPLDRGRGAEPLRHAASPGPHDGPPDDGAVVRHAPPARKPEYDDGPSGCADLERAPHERTVGVRDARGAGGLLVPPFGASRDRTEAEAPDASFRRARFLLS